jgi:hypothetical protein
MDESDDGDWVDHDDHVAVVTALLAEVRRLQADNERMRRGLEEIDSVCGSRAYAVNAMLRNLLAGREWNESGVK